MLVRTLSFLAASTLFAGALTAQPGDSTHYSVAPLMADGALAGLGVEIRFTGEDDGETRLVLPVEWAGADSLWRHLGDVRVDGASSVQDDGPGARRIVHAPGAPLVVRYRVTSAYAEEPAFAFEKARPIILPGWFFFHGEGVFAVPENRGEAPASFAWRDVPAGWTIASDLDDLRGVRAGTVEDVVESVAIGAPDLTVLQREVGGAPLRIALRGNWSFQPQALADAVAGIVDAENRFWGDAGRSFFVPLAPLGGGADGGYSTHGTGRTDAFSIAATANFSLAAATQFLAHEYMHTWNARELGGLSEVDQPMGYWFSEGFTDFYAGRILLRAGLWTPADYVAELNTVLMRNATSPARSATNAVLAARFWSDPDHEKLPYDRGHLFAILVDDRIRRGTDGRADLDDVMQAQRAIIRRGGQVDADAARLFPSTVLAAGVDVSAEIARHVERGEPVTLPADLYGDCAAVQTITQPAFDRGFDLEATQAADLVLAGVDPAGPAYAGGLRDGMRIIRREAGTPGDATVEYAYRVDDGGAERVIRYLPAGRDTITFQRVVLGPDGSSARCVAVMSGA